LAIFHGPWVVLAVIAAGALLGVLLIVIPRVRRPAGLDAIIKPSR
jgi:hypothetical protein